MSRYTTHIRRYVMYQIQSQTPYMLRATFQTIRTKYIAILPVTSDLCDKSSPPPGPGHTDLVGTPDDIEKEEGEWSVMTKYLTTLTESVGSQPTLASLLRTACV